MPRYGLGRIYMPDKRDLGYPMSALLEKTERVPSRTLRYWNANGWWGDQGQSSECVAYAWDHWLEDGPITHPQPAPIVDPNVLYSEAKQFDEWPGEDYDGTSVRGAVKALQKRGLVGAYHWAASTQDIIDCLLNLGPVVVGSNWYESMFDPDESGLLEVNGALAGGHAYKLDGVNLVHDLVRIKNSWGRTWGIRGHALLSIPDLGRLLGEEGEACIAVEIKT